MIANNLTQENLIVGETLKIPKIGSTVIYTVKKGDSLYSIAELFGISVNELIQINSLKSNLLQVGQQLNVPINDNNNEDDYYGYTIYTVQKGDSLNLIALKNNTTVPLLEQINQLNSNSVLSVGQQLKIPYNVIQDQAFENNYLIYIVKPGDNLYSIAEKYNMPINQLKEINDLKDNTINVGQQLKVIPLKDHAIPIGSSCYGPSYVEPTYITYTVKSGDNLYSIAKKYNVSVDSLIQLNDLSNTLLSIGQVLKIKEVPNESANNSLRRF